MTAETAPGLPAKCGAMTPWIPRKGYTFMCVLNAGHSGNHSAGTVQWPQAPDAAAAPSITYTTEVGVAQSPSSVSAPASVQLPAELEAAIERHGKARQEYGETFAGDMTGLLDEIAAARAALVAKLLAWGAETCAEALRQRDALTADANRYRFLRDHTFVEAFWVDGAGGVDTRIRCYGEGEALDLSVDMQRIKEKR